MISPRAPPPADAKSEYGTRQPKLTECVALDAIGARGFGSPAYRGLSCVYGRAPTPGKEAARAKPPASTFLNFSSKLRRRGRPGERALLLPDAKPSKGFALGADVLVPV